MYVDGTANQRGSGVGLVLISLEKIIIEKSLRLGFSATNNEAEYETLLQGMAMVQKIEGKALEVFTDSRSVVGQVKGELEARDVRMQEYLSQVKCLQLDFKCFDVSHVSRSGNTHADLLATVATSSTQGLPRVILVEDLCRADEVKEDMFRIHQVRVGPSWMDPIVSFLKDDTLPEEKSKAEKIRRKVPRFWLSEDHKLYKRSYYGPYLLCIHPEASELLLKEEGLCLIEPSPKDIGGRVCKRKPKSMSRSVINAKGLPQTSTNPVGSSILFLVLSLLLSGAWIL